MSQTTRRATGRPKAQPKTVQETVVEAPVMEAPAKPQPQTQGGNSTTR